MLLQRASFLALVVVVVAGCSTPPSTGTLLVDVALEAGLSARCVKVTADDGTSTLESNAMLLHGMTSLKVGVAANGLASPVTVQAHGFTDVGCTTPSGEESEKRVAAFASPATTVHLTLGPAMGTDGGVRPDGGADGGFDGGTDGGLDAGADAGHDGGTDAGIDGGLDAGIDNDGDLVPLPADCDDGDPNVHPGATEQCANGKDDDCNSQVDCAQASCAGQACQNGGTCMSSTCVTPVEICNDGQDNNMNGLVDCLEPSCASQACNDGNACTLGDTCAADAGCAKTGDVQCTTPPNAQCWVAAGTCLADAGASCSYTTMSGSCTDGLACTTGDTCNAGSCAGTAVTCAAPPTVCFAPGTCTEPSGTCAYAPLAAGTGTCDDGNNCTVNDACAGDGGCAGTAVVCTPSSQCETVAQGICTAQGGCTFNPRTSQPCDAGTGQAATCDALGACVITPVSLFPYTTSNFIDAQLPTPDGGAAVNVNCNVTIDTNGTAPTVTGACWGNQPYRVFTPTGGQQTVIFGLNGLTVQALNTITVTGNKPLILAVVGNVQIDGTITLDNAAGTSSECGNGGVASVRGGGGGGGFGTAGSAGGNNDAAAGGASRGPQNGSASLVPLRAGCNGSNGANTSTGTPTPGGAGGGALQISASGSLTVNGRIAAPGRGGGGGAPNQGGRGGGGGGSGGGILLEGNTLVLGPVASVTANGGGGGEGARTGTGVAGGDGSVLLANGGSGGSGGSGSGGDGAAGGGRAAGPGTAGAAGLSDSGGGGGGGAVGRLRFNAGVSCTISTAVTVVVSPAPTGNGATGCP